jgi:N utilization substance protein A
MKGSRIHGIVRELKNENIDVINWTSNIQLLIQRSLTPAKITSMDLDNDRKHASVYLKPDQVSLAIGRRGVNIKLACELTGYEIDVYRDTEEEEAEFDIDLEEFSDEIETWVIDELKRVGCDTARSVLNLTADELERRTDLEKETIDEVRKVLQAEFEKE